MLYLYARENCPWDATGIALGEEAGVGFGCFDYKQIVYSQSPVKSGEISASRKDVKGKIYDSNNVKKWDKKSSEKKIASIWWQGEEKAMKLREVWAGKEEGSWNEKLWIGKKSHGGENR